MLESQPEAAGVAPVGALESQAELAGGGNERRGREGGTKNEKGGLIQIKNEEEWGAPGGVRSGERGVRSEERER
jgi:hypothetical protein